MRKDFYRGDGSLLGYTIPFNERRTDCYDGNGRFVGWVNQSGTYNAEGIRLAMYSAPGMLLQMAKGQERL